MAGVGTVGDGQPTGPSAESIASIAYRLRGDKRVSLVLVLVGEPPSWPALYKILDVIEEDVGGERALERIGWVPARDLRRFTRSANAIENTAKGGRHARSDYRLGDPSQAMELREASAMIEHLVQRWLRFRAASAT